MMYYDTEEYISGGISGAITDIYSKEANKHAELYYKEIRKMSTDVERISKNTGFSFDQILLIKNYLFINYHNIDGKYKRFDPCFPIAESWRRLAFDPKHIQPHDLILIHHELCEYDLILKGDNQSEAHEKTSKLFNYAKASSEYYEKLVQKTKKQSNNIEEELQQSSFNFIGGAISHLDFRTH